MSAILIVEDEQHLAAGLRFNLEADGFDVETVEDGEAALKLLETNTFDAVVLDVMLPGRDGFTVARELRQGGNYTPILMLTARGRPEDVLQGFAAGADDYLPKPFELRIFLARLNALLRRRAWLAQESKRHSVIIINGREVDLENLEIRAQSETARLTLMEAKLLRHLLDNEGRAVSRKAILEDVWQVREDTDTRAIDNFIVRLRRYLEDDPAYPRHLQTVRGVGYRFVTQPDK
jgi:DNA-binding response OmpR family regulator